VLLKSNQCGTLTRTDRQQAAARDRSVGWNTIQSGRSGESEDVTLSHLAVGLMSDQIKVGSMTRSERTAKWNEVIRIEQDYYVAPALLALSSCRGCSILTEGQFGGVS
jgi:enolase